MLIDGIERSLKFTKGEKLCQQLYQGLLLNRITCQSCHRVSEREEHYYDLNIQVLNCVDIAAALRKYTMAEVLEGESAYACDSCGGKRSALRSSVLASLPPILTFSCNRFKCDRTTNWQREKIVDSSRFPLSLKMDAFLDGGKCSSLAPLESEQEAIVIEDLRKDMVWLDDVWELAMNAAEKLLTEKGIDIHLGFLDNVELKSVGVSVHAVQMQTNGNDDCNEYQLSAVIMHRGTAFSGHYFAYIRDNLNEGSWKLPDSAFEDPLVISVNSGGNGTSGRLLGPPMFVRTAAGALVVDESSALSLLIGIFRSEGTVNASKGNSHQLSITTLGKLVKSNLECKVQRVFGYIARIHQETSSVHRLDRKPCLPGRSQN